MNRKLITLFIAGFLTVGAIMPKQAFAFDLGDILDPFGFSKNSPIPGLPIPLPLPGFNTNNQPQTVNNTTTNINSNNVNSNVNSPGAVVNGATNVTAGDRSATTIHTFDSGYVTTQPGPTSYGPTPYPTYYPTPYPTPNYNNLDASCYVTPTYAYIGDTVTWRVNVSGGNGNYNYYWNGTDGLSSGSSAVSRSYGSTGTKSASVTITSGNQTITRSCGSVYVNNYNYNNYNNYGNYYYNQPLQVSCGVNSSYVNVGSPVNWYATVSGGNGSYQYSWSGTDGLTGSNSSLSTGYNYPGVKTASLTVWSDGQSQTRNCGSVTVSGNQVTYGNYSTYTPNGISCSANLTSVAAGSPVVWSANVPNYSYGTITWGGTDGLYGSGQTLRTTYLKSGAKTAYMIVNINGQNSTIICNNSVQVTGNYTAPKTTSTAKKTTSSASATTPLNVMCMASTENARIGDSIIWTSNVTGGNNGTYKYNWIGSDDLMGVNNMVFKSYSTNGTKAAALTVTSGSQTITQTCSNVVTVGDANLAASSIFTLKNVPWGLISILVIIVLLASIGYLLMSRSKI